MVRTMPDYRKLAMTLYELSVNLEAGYLVAVAEIEHALKQAQQVGYTLGVEEETNRWWLLQDAEYAGEHD